MLLDAAGLDEVVQGDGGQGSIQVPTSLLPFTVFIGTCAEGAMIKATGEGGRGVEEGPSRRGLLCRC